MELAPGNSLITKTAEEGRALALMLARHAIHAMQPDEEVLKTGQSTASIRLTCHYEVLGRRCISV